MSEEVQLGTVSITVSDQSVKYDSNMAVQDIVFWLETVKSMIVRELMEDMNEAR